MTKENNFSIRVFCIVLSIVAIVSSMSLMGITSYAGTNTGKTNYSSYDEPESSGDYAYWNGSKVVKSSSTNVNEIKWMQAALNYCIVNKGVSATKLDVDGSFGPATKSATLAFQKKYGLTQDGQFGPATIKKMKSVLDSSSATTTAKTTTKATAKTTTKASTKANVAYNNYDEPESSGDYVYWNGSKVVKSSSTTTSEIKWIQAALNYCIVNKGVSATVLDVDGSFGPASEKATKAFQKKYSLSQDGKFGPSTIKKIKSIVPIDDEKTTQKTTSKSNGKYDLCWPVSKTVKNYKNITSNLGNRNAPVKGASVKHKGIDIGIASGSKILACADGVVKFASSNSARGKYVVIYHEELGITSVYQHLSSTAVKVGSKVKKGDYIAKSGNTGKTSGPHLHYELVVTKSAPKSVDCAWASNAVLLDGSYKNTSINYEYKN